MALVEVKVPDIGDFDEVAVIEAPGNPLRLRFGTATRFAIAGADAPATLDDRPLLPEPQAAAVRWRAPVCQEPRGIWVDAERDRLGSATGLSTRVLPYREQGVTMYRLILGAYETRDAAENAASDLFAKGLVPQASVMPLTR